MSIFDHSRRDIDWEGFEQRPRSLFPSDNDELIKPPGELHAGMTAHIEDLMSHRPELADLMYRMLTTVVSLPLTLDEQAELAELSGGVRIEEVLASFQRCLDPAAHWAQAVEMFHLPPDAEPLPDQIRQARTALLREACQAFCNAKFWLRLMQLKNRHRAS